MLWNYCRLVGDYVKPGVRVANNAEMVRSIWKRCSMWTDQNDAAEFLGWFAEVAAESKMPDFLEGLDRI